MKTSSFVNSPLGFAIASVFMLPIAALMMVACAVLMVGCWPFVPFAVYFRKMKEEP